MPNTVKVFDFNIDINGAAVIAKRIHLTAGCLTDIEIDTNIRLLKEDLDSVAARMKRAIVKQAAKPIFGKPDA